MFFNKKIFLFIIVFIALFLLKTDVVTADSPTVVSQNTASVDCSIPANQNSRACGKYNLNDLMNIVIRISQIILGITGSLALLAFVYGGFMFLISAGSSERITQAKQIIIGAVIGMVIVFSSYLIIKFTLQALGVQSYNNWNQPESFRGNVVPN